MYALDDVGSGSHVHLSLWENWKNIFMASGGHSKHGMSKVGEEFMAGVLNHLPSILAFKAPLPNSQETAEVVTKVYVGGIPYYSTEDDIQSYFESCGSITEVDCMKFPESGKFRGIAIINFKRERSMAIQVQAVFF